MSEKKKPRAFNYGPETAGEVIEAIKGANGRRIDRYTTPEESLTWTNRDGSRHTAKEGDKIVEKISNPVKKGDDPQSNFFPEPGKGKRASAPKNQEGNKAEG